MIYNYKTINLPRKSNMYNIEYHNFDFTNKNDQKLKVTSEAIVSNIESGDEYYQIFKKQDFSKIIKELKDHAEKIRNFSDLIVISMGGATLNPQMLVRFLGEDANSPKIHFLNNTDPAFFAELMALVNIKNTAFLAISNSGQTLETNALVGCMLAEYQEHNINDIGTRAFFITNPKNGVLKDIASAISATLIPHQHGISGRYSGLSSVSLLVGLIAGINIEAYVSGTNEVINDVYKNKEASKPLLSSASIYNNDKNILVNIGYLQTFDIFLEWYSQIIAESLGKNGKGYTPVRGLGPNDQHSMLQLYLDGPKDKLFTLFYADNSNKNLLNYKTSSLSELGYLANKNLTDINKANYDATLLALKAKELHIRSFVLSDISARAFGAMVCHFMFEIVALSHLMELNPFDQPGVELIKKHSASLVESKIK